MMYNWLEYIKQRINKFTICLSLIAVTVMIFSGWIYYKKSAYEFKTNELQFLNNEKTHLQKQLLDVRANQQLYKAFTPVPHASMLIDFKLKAIKGMDVVYSHTEEKDNMQFIYKSVVFFARNMQQVSQVLGYIAHDLTINHCIITKMEIVRVKDVLETHVDFYAVCSKGASV